MAGQEKPHSDSAAEKEVRAVIECFRSGWERLDAGQILSTLARRDDMVMYGTDVAERWVGYEAVVEPTRAMVAAFSNPVYRWGAGEPLVRVRGAVGWACGDLAVSFDAGGQRVTVVMRSTLVLTREPDGWKIAHAHFSLGQEEAVAGYD